MRRLLGAFGLLLLVGGVSAPAAPRASSPTPDPEVKRTLDAYRAARPTSDELRIFQLDWAASLKEAKARALKEGRPIFFVSTTQLEDAGNLRTGHC